MIEENANFLRARNEKAVDTEKRIGHAAYQRAKIVASIMDTMHTLTHTKIQNAWNVTHLYPFYSFPNYTSQDEERLLLQLSKEDREKVQSMYTMGLEPGTVRKVRRGTTYWTGILTCTEGRKWTEQFEKKLFKEQSFSSNCNNENPPRLSSS